MHDAIRLLSTYHPSTELQTTCTCILNTYCVGLSLTLGSDLACAARARARASPRDADAQAQGEGRLGAGRTRVQPASVHGAREDGKHVRRRHVEPHDVQRGRAGVSRLAVLVSGHPLPHVDLAQ